MDYITVKEASALWHMDISTIGKLLRAGKIAGAAKLGGHWIIPKDSPKPMDGRTRQAKKTPEADFFRFPLYVNFPENSFVPPLSQEEAALRQAQKDYYACKFQKAKDVFELLSERAENIYVKICALFFMCALSALYDTGINWEHYYCKLNLLLSEDFSHKKEMELLLPCLDCILGRYKSVGEKLSYEPEYDYHPSAWYMSAWLSAVHYYSANDMLKTPMPSMEPYETLCRLMERDGYYTDAQELHAVLFIAYYLLCDKRSMLYHLRKVVRIAYEHDLLLVAGDLESYYSDAFNEILPEFPDTFAEQIRKYSDQIHSNFARFAANNNITKLYSVLSKSDYRLVLYALGGYTNRQVADIMEVSERTVVNRYNEIYDKLGITGKSRLVEVMSTALGEKQENTIQNML